MTIDRPKLKDYQSDVLDGRIVEQLCLPGQDDENDLGDFFRQMLRSN